MARKKTKKRIEQPWLFVVTFLLGFQLSLGLYIFSSFIKERTGLDNIGIFFLIAYAASFYVLINLHHLIKRHGKSRMLLMFMMMKVIALLGVGIFSYSVIAVVFALWSLVGGVLMWAAFDNILESFTRNSVTGKTRGIHLTLVDTGVLCGPLLSAWTIERYGFGPVFLIAAAVTLVATAIIFFKYRNVNHGVRRDLSVSKVLVRMIHRKDLIRIYYASFMLELFYAVMSVFTPIYLLSIGFSWVEIGKIITVMLLPFVFLQIPLGIVSDTRTGEQEWLVGGLVIMAFSTGAMSLFGGSSVVFWMGLLFLTRVGAAIVQVMRDSYFYKKIGPSDVDYIDFFRTTKSAAYIFGMAFFSIFLIIFPLKMIFLMLAIFVFTALAPVFRLHDTK